MLLVKIFLILRASTCLAASSIEERLAYLELRLDNALNRTDNEISELKDTIGRMNITDFDVCKEEQAGVLNDTKNFTSQSLTTTTTATTKEDELDKVYAHVEKNSKALMDELEKTLTTLMKQHGHINQKINSNAFSIAKLEQRLSAKDQDGDDVKKLRNNNKNIAQFEDKLSVLDDNVHDLRKDFEAFNNVFDGFWRQISKLDKKDYDISENIERTYHSVASIDHSLVEMDRRYQEFVSDLNNFKRDMRNEIDDLKKELGQTPKVEHVETNVCPDDWIQHGSTCYFYNKESGEDWRSAVRMCQKFGAKLAEPDTKETMDYVRRFVHGWIGASDISNEGIFIWESSKKPVEYFPWWPGMPDNYGGDQDCASIWGTKVNDEDCSKRYRYICEKDIQ